jgi:uncharacterized phage protein gp47/JayE
MAGLNGNGLTIKRLPDIISELESALRLQYGNSVDLTSDSFLGIQNVIYAAANAENWELLQALYNAFIVDVATGKQLEDLAALLKITRLAPTKTFGNLTLFGNSGTIVPVGTQFSDILGNTYENTVQGSLNTGTSRTPVNLVQQGGTGSNGAPSTTWRLTIDGDVYEYQTIWPDTNTTTIVAPALKALIPTSKDYYIELVTENNQEFVKQLIPYFEPLIGSNLNSNTTLNVINKNETVPITVVAQVIASPTPAHQANNTPFAGVGTKVSTFQDTVNVQGLVTGNITTNQNSLINIVTPVIGLNSVNNSGDLINGRDLETDEELRSRFKKSSAINGNTTVPNIEAKILQVAGVTRAFLNENRTMATSALGVPPKSYECVILGGSDEEIAEALWESKPASIETYGNTTVSIVDGQGRLQAVKFSRPTNIYIWVKAYYTKYSEEAFPSTGTTSMASAILTYGSGRGLGEDIISKRFYGSIYSSTTGIQDLRVLTATSTDPLIEPNILEFNDNTILISDKEISSFVASRIEIILE